MSDIKSINFDQLNEDVFFCENKKNIENLGTVNILIGPNNSGKSRFARTLFKSVKHLEYDFCSIPIEKFFSQIQIINQKIGLFFKNNFSNDSYYLNGNTYDLKSDEMWNFSNFTEYYSISIVKKINELAEIFEKIKKDINRSEKILIGFIQNGSRVEETFQLNQIFPIDIIQALDEFTGMALKLNGALNSYKEVIYIPTLRGLRPLRGTDENVYQKRTVDDYFAIIDNDQVIITGLEFYNNLDEMLRGLREKRIKVSEYENFLSENFFNKKSLNLIPQKGKDFISVMVGEEEEHPIFEFGDGLQSLIVNTYHPFFNDKPTIYFIEEPDVYMHPGMQRKFLDVLTSSSLKHHQFFLTTHSNHLIDISRDFSDVSIFKFKKTYEDKKQRIDITNFKQDDRSLLDDLGIRNSSVLLSNSAIWVEGVSDRYFYRYFFKKYLESRSLAEEIKEDIHYTFVEYNGNNLPHFLFDEDRVKLHSITPNYFFILDGDAKTKGNWADNLNKFKVKHHFLNCKEVECLIPSKAFISFCRDKNILPDIDNFINYEVPFDSKFENKYISLASYLNDIIVKNNIDRRNAYFLGEKNTFTQKSKFSKEIIPYIEDLSGEVNILCEKIFEFVIEKNALEKFKK